MGARAGGAAADAALATSRRIIERRGGRLWVRSSPEQGTTFYRRADGTADATAVQALRRAVHQAVTARPP